MTHRAAHNLTDRPLVIDDQGHTIGGGEWAPVDDTQEHVIDAVTAGDLVLVDEVASDATPDAIAAQQAAEAANRPIGRKQAQPPAATDPATKTEEK